MCRLDAGTFGTMGVGLGFAIAAAAMERSQKNGQRIVCVEGDSAFGFSGMEVETICRCFSSLWVQQIYFNPPSTTWFYILICFTGIICPWSSSWSIIMVYMAEWIQRHGKKCHRWETWPPCQSLIWKMMQYIQYHSFIHVIICNIWKGVLHYCVASQSPSCEPPTWGTLW